MCNLHGHVTQPAETGDANFLALRDAPVAHGRVCRDPSAEERRRSGEIEVGGDAQHEMLIDDDAVGVTTVGHPSEILIRRVKGEPLVWTEVLQAGFAPGTRAVGSRPGTRLRRRRQSCIW